MINLDKAIKKFSKAVGDFRAAEAYHNQQAAECYFHADKMREVAEDFDNKAEAHDRDAERAETIARRLEELLSV